jgi:hypothetical protein
MLGYRLYILDDAGHIVKAIEATYETDAQAIEWAKQQVDENDLELWTGARVVAELAKRTPSECAR